MKFMVIVRPADLKSYEADAMPKAELKEQLKEMGKFNDELRDAGMMIFAEGLKPTSKGARINFGKDGAKISEGPFSDINNLVCGFWLLNANSKAEVLEWMKRAPMQDGDSLEIRQIETDLG